MNEISIQLRNLKIRINEKTRRREIMKSGGEINDAEKKNNRRPNKVKVGF